MVLGNLHVLQILLLPSAPGVLAWERGIGYYRAEPFGYMTMSNLPVTFIGMAILCLVISFIGHNNGIVDGLGKAFFGVFLILFFIVKFFGEKNA